jgi:hypothetical protein
MTRCPVGTEFFHAYGQIGMTILIVAFHSFANAPNNDCYVGTKKILTLWPTREACVCVCGQ